VTEGRRREFSGLAEFAHPSARSKIPDPGALQTFLDSKLSWDEMPDTHHGAWLEYYRSLLRIRRDTLAPLLHSVESPAVTMIRKTGAIASWRFPGNRTLNLDANFGDGALDGFDEQRNGVIYSTHDAVYAGGVAPPWSVRWSLGE
jgi:1,4-alpha-glucan branching enzyme/maltooligosyltrehalose trehalohydrolase